MKTYEIEDIQLPKSPKYPFVLLGISNGQTQCLKTWDTSIIKALDEAKKRNPVVMAKIEHKEEHFKGAVDFIITSCEVVESKKPIQQEKTDRYYNVASDSVNQTLAIIREHKDSLRELGIDPSMAFRSIFGTMAIARSRGNGYG